MNEKEITINGKTIKLSGWKAGGKLFIAGAPEDGDYAEFVAMGLRAEGFTVKVTPVIDSEGLPIFFNISGEMPA